ncbi:MAG: hypothetical protein IJW48_03075 [Clostridia bacterium]|nr:hypothetical protein [Clostridia bacterium]
MSGDNGSEKRTALEFETVTAAGLVFEAETAAPPEQLPEDTLPEAAKSEAVATDGDEFSLPESFSVNEKYSSESFIEDPLRIRTTYVPRFTEASERYRMANRPQAEKPIQVEKNEGPAPECELDPTAELDEERKVEKVVVSANTGVSDTFSDESIKIYKFETDEEAPPPKIPEASDVPVKQPEAAAPQAVSENTESEELSADEEHSDAAEKEMREEAVILPSPVRKYAEGEEPKGSREAVRRSKNKLFPEYTARSERDSFKDRFLDAIMSVRVRLAAIALVILSLVAAEIVFSNLSPYDMGGFLAGSGALVDLLFSTALFALALPELVRAVRYLAAKTVTPELMLPLSYLIILGFSLTAAFGGEVGVRYMHFSLPFSLQVAFSVLAAYFRLDGEFLSFKMISTGKPMWVLDKRFTRTLDKENIALDGAVDEYSSKLARVFRTSFVSDYTSNISKIRENGQNVLTVLGISLGASLVTGTIALFLTDSTARFAAAFETFSVVFFFAVPAFSLLVHKLPLNRLLRMAKASEHTFVGEGAVLDTAEVDVIAYDDTEIFGEEDVSIRKVHLYGKVYNTAKAMQEMYSLFAVVGGPLARVFSESLDRKCEPAESVTLFDDGIVGYFEGHKVMAGSEEFMLRNNVKIPEDDYKTKPEATDTTRVMYGAEDGEVYVKFFIRYSFMEEFSMLLPDLRREHIVPLVYTRDPNIDADMLRVLTLGEDVIRVLKEKELPAPDEVFAHISSGAVSLGEKFSVPEMLLTARAYRARIIGASIGELMIMMSGAAMASVLSLVLMGRISSVPAFVPALWQLLPGVALYVRSRMSFKLPKKDKEK